MPARTTSSRRPASASRGRSGSTASRKRAPAKRSGTRRPASRKKNSPGLWGVISGGWNLLARGAGGLARSVARPDEAEPLAPEHRRDGIGLAVLGLSIVLGAAAWSSSIGPVGVGLAQGVRWIVGSMVMVLPVVLFFVAFKFYGVLAVAPVFALMVLIAALAAALAVLQDARGLAVIGALGGFATPLLVSTGSGNQVALFSYYLLLNLLVFAVAWFKPWRALNLIGFAFTFGIGSTWGALRYRPEDFASTEPFLMARTGSR